MKPLLFFDIEATGTDPVLDRIVTLSAVKMVDPAVRDPFSMPTKSWMFHPQRTMSDEVIAIHGIRNEDVAMSPAFHERAEEVSEWFVGCDLAGYNLRNFDIPMLWEEFFRADMEWDTAGIQVIDMCGIFRKKEPRDLTAALRFYCGAEMQDAHDAHADTCATVHVMHGQLARYADLAAMDRAALAKFSHQDDRLDLAGKLRRDDKGRIVYGFGKNKGLPVADDPGFAEWMLRQPWISIQTKRVLRAVLRDLFDETTND